MASAAAGPPQSVQLALLAFSAVSYHCLRRVAKRWCARDETFQKLNQFDQQRWLSRLVSQVHCVAAVPMSVVAVRGVSAGGLWTASALIHADTWLLALCLCHTAGFLLYDLADMVRARQRLGRSDGGPLVLLHHLFGILGVLIGVGHHNCAALYALFVFTEVSTPFLNNVFFAEMRGRGPRRRRTVCGSVQSSASVRRLSEDNIVRRQPGEDGRTRRGEYPKPDNPRPLGDAFLRTVNGVLLFLTYAPRVILPPAVASAVYKLWPEFRKVALAMRLYVLAMLAFATVMNYYWWYKIGRGCWKGLQGLSFLQMARLHKKSVEDERAAACTAGHGRANAAGRTAAVSNRVASSPN